MPRIYWLRLESQYSAGWLLAFARLRDTSSSLHRPPLLPRFERRLIRTIDFKAPFRLSRGQVADGPATGRHLLLFLERDAVAEGRCYAGVCRALI